MITKEQAHKLVAEAVAGKPEWLPEGDEIIIVESETIERPVLGMMSSFRVSEVAYLSKGRRTVNRCNV